MKQGLLKKSIVWTIVAVAAVTATVILCDRHAPGQGDSGKILAQSNREKAKRGGKGHDRRPGAELSSRQKEVDPDSDGFEDFAPKDRALAQAVQAALDNDDLDATLRATAQALKSSNVAVRLAAVEALGWFGEKTLTELTPCMADPDAGVAEAAMNAWELGLSEIDSAKNRFDISLMALNVISDENALKMIGSQFANAATDIIADIDDDKAASAKRVEIIQSIVDMVSADQPVRAMVGREIYEDVTGHEWVSVEEAERYLANPDEYEPPEDRAKGTESE